MNKYFAICSPSLGFLDNLLPILYDLKVRDSDCNITLIIPRAFDTDQLRKNNQFLEVSSDIFDRVLFRKHSGKWESESSLKSLSKRKKSSVLTHYLYGLYRKIKRISLFSNFLSTSEFDAASNLKKIVSVDDDTFLFYDIRFENRVGIKEFIDIFNNNLKISINHGTGIFLDNAKSKKNSLKDRKDVLVLAVSKKEVKPYINSFNISQKNIFLSGIPRHDLEWIKKMKNSSMFSNPFMNRKYVLIVSRRLKGNFKDKIRVLKQIRDYLILEKGIPILIKLHPTERSFALDYKLVFGVNNYGKNWKIVDSHAFHISQNCKFVISFYSGLCLDMLIDDIPTIEYMPIRNEIKNPASTNVFRYYGLVCVAYDLIDFKQTIDKILDDKFLSEKYLNNYKKLYFYPVGNELVSNRILLASSKYKKENKKN